MLPEDMRPAFAPYVDPNQTTYEWRLVKAADRISAYLKCIEEEKMGQPGLAHAKLTIYDAISQNPLPEVHEFMLLLLTEKLVFQLPGGLSQLIRAFAAWWTRCPAYPPRP